MPDESLCIGLPVSPPEKTYNLRSSTIEKTENSRKICVQRELEKIKKNSKKFIELVDTEYKILFSEIKSSAPPHLFKCRLKRLMQISQKINPKKRNEVFKKYKTEKIERFGLETYGT